MGYISYHYSGARLSRNKLPCLYLTLCTCSVAHPRQCVYVCPDIRKQLFLIIQLSQLPTMRCFHIIILHMLTSVHILTQGCHYWITWHFVPHPGHRQLYVRDATVRCTVHRTRPPDVLKLYPEYCPPRPHSGHIDRHNDWHRIQLRTVKRTVPPCKHHLTT